MRITEFVSIYNNAENHAIIEIFGDIGYNFWADTYEEYKSNTKENIRKELKAIKEIDAKEITVMIESLGGDLDHGLNIYQLLKNSGAKVNTQLFGRNASAATLIAMAGDQRHMANSGLFLAHKSMGLQFGNENDMRVMVGDLKKHDRAAKQVYLNAGIDEAALNNLMEKNGGHGIWLTADEALEHGFVTSVFEAEPIMNYSNSSIEKRNIPLANLKNNQSNAFYMENTIVKKLDQILNSIKSPFKKSDDGKMEVSEEFTNAVENLSNVLTELKEKEENDSTEFSNKIDELSEKMSEFTKKIEETINNKIADAVISLKQGEIAAISEKVNKVSSNGIEYVKVNNQVDSTENLPNWKKHLKNYQDSKTE